MNVVLFEPKWHKMVCRLLVLVETKFKRRKSLVARLYEKVDFRDEMTQRNRLFTKSPFRCDFIQRKGHFVQAAQKGLHTSFLPHKFAPELNIKTCRTMKRLFNHEPYKYDDDTLKQGHRGVLGAILC